MKRGIDMKWTASIMEDVTGRNKSFLLWFTLIITWLLCGCQSTPPNHPSVSQLQRQTFTVGRIAAEQSRTILSELGLAATSAGQPNTVEVSGSPDDLHKATVILSVIDSNEPHVVETLGPATMARTLPSNETIAKTLGITIATFASTDQVARQAEAIVDVHRDRVIAIIPQRVRRELIALVQLGPDGLKQIEARRDTPTDAVAIATDAGEPKRTTTAPNESTSLKGSTQAQVSEPAIAGSSPQPAEEPSALEMHIDSVVQAAPPSAAVVENAPASSPASLDDDSAKAQPPAPRQSSADLARGVLRSSRAADRPASAPVASVVPLENGDDVLELSLPEKIELMQLLDLAGEYLHLDCVYDADKIANQMITLKLHSKMRSEIRVRDLYSLLETILRFKGLAMTRQKGNLVAIVPAAEVMTVDPELVDPNSQGIRAGDVVVTRVFDLQYVDVASVSNLLTNMKLSVAVSPIEDTQTLFVTCYASRMDRIEQLVQMVDKPGKPKEFRFRQLKHTAVEVLSRKLLALTKELQDIPITIGSTRTDGAAGQKAAARAGNEAQPASSGKQGVYLDTDERTNRLLMIGYAEQLEVVEGLIDALDIADQRGIHTYEIKHVKASDVLEKLTQLGVVTTGGQTGAKAAKITSATTSAESPSVEQPQVVLLEATNSLLINAKQDQHKQIQMVINYIDIVPQDLRTLKVYPLSHVQAEDAVLKLQQLGLIGSVTISAPRVVKPAAAGDAAVATPAMMTSRSETITVDQPQVVVLEATNSLLINATPQQHQRIQGILEHIDLEARKETLPYEIYFLENQDPNRLAEVLGRLVQETIKNKEGKVEQVIQKSDEPVTIIPDPGTFSLIVHASRKNQEWIAGLIQKLDKRRPQVLIDVTLVEITETDAFTYDLNLIKSIPDLTATSGLMGNLTSGQSPVTSSDIVDKLNATGRDRFIDTQSASGDFTAFYGDRHINALLRAMQSKNYGRILAKPKILVNDNQPGTIKTADTTYVVKRTSVPVSSGGAGTNATLIETAVDYQSYEAGITLDITPHISDGNLLRLDIELKRSDFRETEDVEKPPDTTTSELKTTAFIPDASTIILGGLLKLNQNKGGAKVPILGDIPLVGILFRSINNKDAQSKLYIFVKAEIIRPASMLARGATELESISQKNREAFEKHELEFQNYQSWPGIKSQPIEPAKVLEVR